MIKAKIAIIIYSNPDYLPSVNRAISILSNQFEVVVITRNQDNRYSVYGPGIEYFQLGKPATAVGKQSQHQLLRIMEYLSFIVRARHIVKSRSCKFVYSYDIHGYLAAYFCCRIAGRLPLLYHNLDIYFANKRNILSIIFRSLELYLIRRADAVVFCNRSRLKYFKDKAILPKNLFIVMNTPLKINDLPENKLREVLIRNGFSGGERAVFYQGTIDEQHYLPQIIRSIKFWPADSVLVICGIVSAGFQECFTREVESSEFKNRILVLPYLPHPQLKFYTVGASLGIALYNQNTEDVNMRFMSGASNKIFEYISLGVPVLANDSEDFRNMLDSSAAYFTKSYSEEDIGNSINLALSDASGLQRKKLLSREAHLLKLNYEYQFAGVLSYIKSIYKI